MSRVAQVVGVTRQKLTCFTATETSTLGSTLQQAHKANPFSKHCVVASVVEGVFVRIAEGRGVVGQAKDAAQLLHRHASFGRVLGDAGVH